MQKLSLLQIERQKYVPILPKSLENIASLDFEKKEPCTILPEIQPLFPELSKKPSLKVTASNPSLQSPLKIGVVLSGGQAPGGHNVISGIFDAMQKLHPESSLIGFLNGPSGIIKNQYIELKKELIDQYRNSGGFDIIGSGRTKIESEEQFIQTLNNVKFHNLDGLIVIGGDDSNTNAAMLSEYFLQKNVPTRVIGAPKTIDGDLKGAFVECSFGFDSASKTYSEIIGNILKDARSAKKYYYFIKLMGRSASHLTLECALATQPNLALIAEEIEAKHQTLAQVVSSIADLIVDRQKAGKEFGVILIPEGVIEFLHDMKALIHELNRILAQGSPHVIKLDLLKHRAEKIAYASAQLSRDSLATFNSLPQEIQLQLLLDRDPHGNVQVSRIETERLLIEMVTKELEKRRQAGGFRGKFSPQSTFCGYEGRSCLPSNFDCNYCYSLGTLAALLVARGITGFMAAISNLSDHPSKWEPVPISLPALMHMEEREGIIKPVIAKALVNLQGKPFVYFANIRDAWRLGDEYIQPGPIQFSGPDDIVNSITFTLMLEKGK